MANLKMELTPRDKKLVVFLGIFLVIAFFCYLVIVPLAKSNTALQEQIIIAEQEKLENEEKIQLLESARLNYETIQDNLAKVQENFYPFMASQEIDRMLTTMALESNLNSRNLTINMPSAELVLAPYQSLTTVASKEETAAQTVQSVNLYAAQIQWDLTGSESSLKSFTDKLSFSAPSIRILTYNLSIDPENTGAASSLAVSLEIYMYNND